MSKSILVQTIAVPSQRCVSACFAWHADGSLQTEPDFVGSDEYRYCSLTLGEQSWLLRNLIRKKRTAGNSSGMARPPMAVPTCVTGGGYEIRTREGVNPTRFPSVRHRPTRRILRRRGYRVPRGRSGRPSVAALGRLRTPLTRRHLPESPQGRKAARVGELWRVREGSSRPRSAVSGRA